jgi:hypothetical protein
LRPTHHEVFSYEAGLIATARMPIGRNKKLRISRIEPPENKDINNKIIAASANETEITRSRKLKLSQVFNLLFPNKIEPT